MSRQCLTYQAILISITMKPKNAIYIGQDEVGGSLTLKTLPRIVDALDWVFVYGFVPRKTLEDTLRNQAMHVANEVC